LKKRKRRRTSLGNAAGECETALTRLISANVNAAKSRLDQRARFKVDAELNRARAAFSGRCLRK